MTRCSPTSTPALAAAQTHLAREREALASADEATRAVLRDLNEAEARRARLELEIQDGERRLREEAARAQEAARERVAAEEQRVERMLNRSFEQSFEQALDDEARSQTINFGTRDTARPSAPSWRSGPHLQGR